MRAIAIVLLLCGPALASPQSALTTACVRGQFSVLGRALGEEAAESITNGPTALSQMGGAFDSTISELGSIFLDHPQTIGLGRANLVLLGQTEALGEQNGHSLDPSQTVIFTKPLPVGARVTFDARIRQAAIGFAFTYGLLDNLDASILFPLVYSRARVTATRQITDVRAPDGNFVHVTGQPVVSSSGEGSAFAQGDMTVRLKYQLAPHWAVTTSWQFPTGDPILLTGTGHYWMDPVLAASWPWWSGRAEAGFNVGMLVDLSRPAWSKVSYGVSTSAVLIPRRLGAVLEVFGQSDVTSHISPDDTAVLVLLPNRTLKQQPALNIFFQRTDQVNLSAGFRIPILSLGLIMFVTAVVPLNQQGVRPVGAFVTTGLGGNF